VPKWVPTVDSIKTAFQSVIENVKANIQKPGKSKKELAIELTLVVVQFLGITLCIIGIPMGNPWFLAQISGVALILLGAFYFVAAAATMGTQLTFLPTANPGVTLQTEGVFGHCRHPQYFGVISICLGLSLLFTSSSRLLWTVVVWLVLDKKADIEEMYLAEEKHDLYPTYMATKPKFIPGRLVTGQPEVYSTLEEEQATQIAE